MRESKRRAKYWDGIRDALVYGMKDPGKPENQKAEAQLAYEKGFGDGKRIEKRLIGTKEVRRRK